MAAGEPAAGRLTNRPEGELQSSLAPVSAPARVQPTPPGSTPAWPATQAALAATGHHPHQHVVNLVPLPIRPRATRTESRDLVLSLRFFWLSFDERYFEFWIGLSDRPQCGDLIDRPLIANRIGLAVQTNQIRITTEEPAELVLSELCRQLPPALKNLLRSACHRLLSATTQQSCPDAGTTPLGLYRCSPPHAGCGSRALAW